RYFKDHAPDAMFSSMGPQNIAAINARRFAGAKSWLGVMQHNALSDEAKAGISLQQRLVPIAYRFFLGSADGVYAVSAGVADDMAAVTGFPRSRIGVLYNPACPENLDPAALPAIDHPYYSSGLPVVIGCGRLVAQKGWATLLRAFAKVIERRPARLVVLGVGPEEAELKALASELGLEGSADFVGFQSMPLAWMRASDLFVMSSRYEGFGNVIVEALATGTSVVSTNCNYGPSEILDDGKYGELVPVEDPAAMADAICRSLDAPSDPDRLIARAREFTVSHVVDNYLTAAFGWP
ncbi:MAG: glycosyltransferase, partial [Sphingobium sp.]